MLNAGTQFQIQVFQAQLKQDLVSHLKAKGQVQVPPDQNFKFSGIFFLVHSLFAVSPMIVTVDR